MGYKVNDWLKNRHTGQLIEVVEVKTENIGQHMYTVKKIYNNPTSWNKTFCYNYSILQEHYELLPLARLLYSKKVTSEVTNENND